MKNTRLVYIKTQKLEHEYAAVLEQIDNYLDQSKYLELVNNHLLIYGKKGEEQVRVGREIYGREEDIYHSEIFRVCDYSANEKTESKSFTFSYLEDLLVQVRETQTSHENFRIQIKLGNPNQTEVLFF